ncbi:hypothetical protein FAEPRAA2165_01770 [Faecalibacterium duncaniae]|uniref:Uncharacterized protein n=1 Tax=Faecalibacterium duncaniae (strain DSM 17677 / JCM 31915 / A2-165) TaxID=411483 RepID=C7H645_FAED2|nr:hypothetical protein FAEPRAA2165_01770 [Faecalibacterium duncaniae]
MGREKDFQHNRHPLFDYKLIIFLRCSHFISILHRVQRFLIYRISSSRFDFIL